MEDLLEARRHLADSLSIDPKYARCYTMLASTHRVAWLNPLNDEYLNPTALDRAIKLARRAVELNPTLSEAYAELGYNIIRKRDFDAATAAAERAIALNPTFADYRWRKCLPIENRPEQYVAKIKCALISYLALPRRGRRPLSLKEYTSLFTG
jgi:adenylate cyclase